jgi:hypothetical protein
LTFLKVLHRRNPVNRNLLKPLTARADSRQGTFEEATELAATWHSINPSWSPEVGETLSTFETFIQHCRTLQEIVIAKKNAWQIAASALRQMADDLNDECVAWYELATVMFSTKTAEGAMIRGTVPTTYQRPKPEEQPELELGEIATSTAKNSALPGLGQLSATTSLGKNILLDTPPIAATKNILGRE